MWWGVAAGAQTERWEGPYYCSQGVTQMTLTVLEREGDQVTAEFVFYANADNPNIPTGCYVVEGTLGEGTDGVSLRPKEWIEQPDAGWVMTPIRATLDPQTRLMRGWIDHLGCGGLRLEFIADGASAAPTCQMLIG